MQQLQHMKAYLKLKSRLSKNRKKADASGVKGEFVVLVKPTSGSNFKNFVDIMDELEILKIKVRQIDDDNILDSEKESMRSQGIL